MYNMCAWVAVYIVRCSVYASKGQLEGKDVGWNVVIKTINNLLWRSVASSVGAPKWGQSRSQYTPRKGPCRTCSRGASRRPKPKNVHDQFTCIHVKRYLTFFFKHTHWKTNIQDIHCSKCTCTYHLRLPSVLVHKLYSYNNRCLFSQVKNKPWIPWVYTWC